MTIKIIASSSKGNCYTVSDGTTTIMLECGLSIKQIRQGLNYTLSDISGVLVTHRHNDHSAAIKALAKNGIDIYADSDVFESKGMTGHHRCHEVMSMVKYRLGSYIILPFDVTHDVPNLGYIIHSTITNDRLMYFTDTCMVKYKFDGITHIMAECNHSDERMQYAVENKYINKKLAERVRHNHMSLKHLIEFFKANDLRHVRDIYLLHLSDNNSVKDEFHREVRLATGKNVII